MVFMKPHIIRSAEDLAEFSSIRYEEVRRDGQLARLEEMDFLLIPDTDPPVLDDYESVINEGMLTSERRRELAEKYREKGVPENKIEELIRLLHIDDILQDEPSEFQTQGSLEEVPERKVIDLFQKRPPVNSQFENAGQIDDEANRIEWDQAPGNAQ